MSKLTVVGSSTVSLGGTDNLTLTLVDDDGNPVVGQTPVSLAVSPTGNALAPPTVILIDGIGSFDLTAFTVAGPVDVTAMDGFGDLATATVTILPGPPSAATSSLVASKSMVFADGVSQNQLTVTVEDAFGNRLAGTAVSLSASGNDNVFGAIEGVTDANGVFITTLASNLAQTETVTATEGGVQESATVAFVALPPPPPQPQSLTVMAGTNTISLGGSDQITVTLRDENGNLVVGQTDVALSVSPSVNVLMPDSVHLIDGVGSFVLTASTVAESVDVTATVGGNAASATVTILPGPPSAVTSSLVASEATVPANGTSQTTLTVTVEDAFGNPLAGTAVSLSASGSDNAFGAINGLTDAQGVFTTTLASALAQTETVTATEAGVQESAAVTFADVLTAQPATISANANQAFSGKVATFTNADPNALAGDFTATIDWGDGTTSAGTVTGGNGTFAVVASHTFAAAGQFPVAITLADNATGTATASANDIAEVTASEPPQFVTLPGTLQDILGPVIAAAEKPPVGSVLEDAANINVNVATFLANGSDTAADFVATITWGDGTTTFGTVNQAGSETFSSGIPGLPTVTVNQFVVTGTHTYADEGSFPVDVAIIRTTDNASGTLSGTVTVTDADVLTPAPASPIVAAPNTLSFTGPVANFTDVNTAGTASDFVATIAWGDGSTSAGTVTDIDGAVTVAGSHTFATTGELPVTVTLSEDTPGAATATAHNTAFVGLPLAGEVILTSVAERAPVTGPIATFTDIDTGDLASAFTATIDWGDGTTSAATVSGSNGAFTLSGAHAYADEGVFPLSTTIIRTADSSTITLSGAVTATEADVLAAEPTTFNANANQPFTSTIATFTDADPSALAGDFTASVDWGDGTTSAGAVTGGNGTFTVVGSHMFAAAGQFPVAVTLTDKPSGTATATAENLAEVSASALPLFLTAPEIGLILDVLGPEIAAVENQFLLHSAVEDTANTNVSVAGFLANAGDTAADFIAAITWGDGTTTFGTVNLEGSQTFTSGSPVLPTVTVNEFVVTGTHTYAGEGSLPINVAIVRTTDNVSGTFNSTVTVADADVLTPAPANPIVADPTTLSYDGPVTSFTDTDTVSPARDFSATINWGDGTTSAGIVTGGNGTFTVAGAHTFTAVGDLPVSVTLVDDFPGTATAIATTVAEVHRAPTPTLTVSIAGSAIEGSTLTATSVAGPAGDSGSVSYLWQSSADGMTFAPIAGAADSPTYVLAEGDENREVRVEATFADQFGQSVTADSDATTPVKDTPPTFSVSISGKAVEGRTLTAMPVIGTDGDGGTISYVWESSADGGTFTPIAGAANSPIYVLADGDENREVRVEATFTDDTGQSVTADSNATTFVKDAPPTLSLAVSGTVAQDQTLTAVPTIGTDADGGTIMYQWQSSTDGAHWTNIALATSSTYLVQQSDGGNELRVEAIFTDDTNQSVMADSAATGPVVAMTANPERLVISEGTELLPITSWLLANDSSPSGNVHVTSVDGRSSGLVALAPGYTALLVADGQGGDLVFLDIDDDVVARNATAAPDIAFSYTVSDGIHSAVATDEIAAVKVAPSGLNLASSTIGPYDFSFISGSNGNGTLAGGAGVDTLVGGDGKITISGGGNGDILAAGHGPTIFKYAAPTDSSPGFTGSLANFDTVVDFDPEVDKFDFSAISGIASVAQRPLASATSTIDAHSIGWSLDRTGDQTILYVNDSGQTEHAGATDMEIHLVGQVNFKASDFTLAGAQRA